MKMWKDGFVAMLGLPLGLWVLAGGAGCSTTDSTNVKTSGIWAHYVVRDNGDGSVDVRAVLRVGGSTGTVVDLTNGEHMEVNGVTLTEFYDPITNLHWSHATVSDDPMNRYDFDFIRTDDTGTPIETVSTAVIRPALPVISDVNGGADISYGQDVTITWDASEPGDDVDITISGDCIDDLSYPGLSDSGQYVVSHADMPMIGTQGCDLTIRVQRNVTTDVSAEFQGGFAEAHSFHSVTVGYSMPRAGN
ncbi:MAG: hypothetical protein J7M25_10075 [Deltaproteobacteria bacterium]|nr:hypothetical protein [Deltaproteobacteria bacterium]